MSQSAQPLQQVRKLLKEQKEPGMQKIVSSYNETSIQMTVKNTNSSARMGGKKPTQSWAGMKMWIIV
jgi:hypothetical protein